MKGVSKSSLAFMVLTKGQVALRPDFCAVLFQDDWIITSFDLGRIQGIIFDLGNIRVTLNLFGVIMNFVIAV